LSEEKNLKYEEISEKKFDIIKKILEGYARGVSQFISMKYKLSNRISNAFCKLWDDKLCY
jgi:hypothetical protein